MEQEHGDYIPPLNGVQAEWLDSVQESLDLLRDPEMDRVIAKAKAANEMMGIVLSTKRERTEVLADLDAQWARWDGQPLTVSGKVKYPVTFEGKTENREAILWDTRVISNGFNIGTLTEDTPEGGALARVVYQFQVPVDSLPEQFENRTMITVQAPLDEMVVDSTLASKERAYSWLSALYPEFVQEIDALISTSMSEVDALQALSSLDLSSIDLDNELARNCVEAYIKSQVIIDKKMPYGMVLQGEVSHYNAILKKPIYYDVTNMKTIAKISSVKLVLHHEAGQPEEWRLGVKASTLPRDRRESGMKYTVPLSTIKTIVSLRDEFYHD
jgi:hypothetical protein